MKYATLRVNESEYFLYNEKGMAILVDKLPKRHYMYEQSIVFNILYEQGWKVLFQMNSDNWYMMARI
jgi:hypothetical protein